MVQRTYNIWGEILKRPGKNIGNHQIKTPAGNMFYAACNQIKFLAVIVLPVLKGVFNRQRIRIQANARQAQPTAADAKDTGAGSQIQKTHSRSNASGLVQFGNRFKAQDGARMMSSAKGGTGFNDNWQPTVKQRSIFSPRRKHKEMCATGNGRKIFTPNLLPILFFYTGYSDIKRRVQSQKFFCQALHEKRIRGMDNKTHRPIGKTLLFPTGRDAYGKYAGNEICHILSGEDITADKHPEKCPSGNVGQIQEKAYAGIAATKRQANITVHNIRLIYMILLLKSTKTPERTWRFPFSVFLIATFKQ
jgi:hypothetical protein